MKKLFFRFDFSPKIKKFLTTLHNTQEQAILWIIRQLLPFLFPRHCPLCDKLLPYGSFIHEECHRELPLIHSPVCMRCGKPVSSHTQEYCYDCRAFPKSFQRGLSLFLYNKKTSLWIELFLWKCIYRANQHVRIMREVKSQSQPAAEQSGLIITSLFIFIFVNRNRDNRIST